MSVPQDDLETSNENDLQADTAQQASESESNNIKKPRPKKKKRSLLGRLITSIFSTVFMLVILVISLLYFFIDTQAGLKTLTYLANRYASEYVSIEEANGRLGKDFSLKNVEVRLPNYPALEIPYIALKWDYWQLLEKNVDIESLQISGADLNFTPIAEVLAPSETESTTPFSLKDLNIPINATLSLVDLDSSTLKIGDTHLAVNNFRIEALTLVDNHLRLKDAIGDLQVLVGSDIDLPFIVALNGDVTAETELLDLNLAVYAQDALIQGNELNLALNSELKGTLDQFDLNLDGRVDWQNVLNDPILLKLNNHITSLNEVKTYLHIKNLKNQITLNSLWLMDKPSDFDLDLKMNVPYLSQLHPGIRGSVYGDIDLEGDLMKPLLTADMSVKGLSAFGVQLESLQLNGTHDNYDAKVSLEANRLKFQEFYLALIGLHLDGTLTEEFEFDLVVKDLVKAESPADIEEVTKKYGDTLDIEYTKTSEGEDDEEVWYAENVPLDLTPKGSVEVLVENMIYDVKGTAESHKFKYALNSLLGNIQSTGIASLKNITTDPSFHLFLEQSNVQSPYVGDFKLNKPAYFYFNALQQVVKLSPVCYQQNYVAFCTEGARTDKGLNTAVMTLHNLPSSLLTPYLPEDISINTKANATIAGKFTTMEDFLGIVNVSLSKGDIRYRLQGREVLVPLDKTQLEVLAKPQGITSNLNVDWGKYLAINGKASLTDLLKENLVDASLKANIPSFDWVSPLVPVLQDLNGQVNFTSTVTGSLHKPTLAADLSVRDGRLYVASLNSRLKDINLDVNLKEGTPEFFIKGNIGTNEGNLKLDGYYNIANYSTAITADGENLLLADSDNIKVKVTPHLKFVGTGKNGGDKYQLTGTVRVPELTYLHSSGGSGGSVVTVSEDTIIIGDGSDQSRESSFMDNFKMDLNVILGQKILVGAEGLKANLSGSLKVLKDYQQPIRGLGVINVGKGEFDIYGQVLTLDRGKIQFSGTTITNPALDIQASRKFVNEIEGREMQVGVKVLGSVEAPRIQLYSSPAMTDIEIASYLFLGRSPNLESPTENLMLLNMVRKVATGAPISSSEESIANQLGLTDLGFVTTPTGATGVGLGKRFANSFYVGLGVGIEDSEGAFAIFRYNFMKYFNLNTAFMSEGESFNINYLRDF
ncbi:translocation/assembly module TamB domain-containing protein [Ignatzschineria sp. LJL83]